MKKLLFIIILFPFAAFSQSDCDTTICAKYADLNSFEIIGTTNLSEFPNIEPPIITCNMLCYIEQNRSSIADIEIKYQSYRILVHKKEHTEFGGNNEK